MSLWADFLTNDARPGRAICKWAHYFPVYEWHFSRFRNLPITVLEIGVGAGGSLQMWKRYFGPHAQIVGIDITPESKKFEEHQIAVRIGNQADAIHLQKVVEEFGPPDIVIDDGSHKQPDVLASFSVLYPRMAKNGVYLVEDLSCAYASNFGGGYKQPGTFIELCKGLIDELNGEYSGQKTEFSADTLSMHFYDSMAVFERGRYLPRSSMIVGRDWGDVLKP